MNAKISVHSSSNCRFSLSAFLLAVNLLLQLAKSQCCDLLQKRKLKLKIALAVVIDPVTRLCIVGMDTSPGIHVPTQPKHMVKE